MAARNGGPGGPVAVDHLPLVSAGYDGMTNMELRGARSATGRGRAPPAGRPRATRPQVACRSSPLGEDARRGLGDGHGRGRAGGLRLLAHAAAPPQQAPACAAAGGEDRRVRRGRPGRYQEVLGADGMGRVFRAVLTDNGAEFPPTRRRSRRCSARGRATRGCSIATPGEATRRALCERNHVERWAEAVACWRAESGSTGSPGRPGAGHVARELRSARGALGCAHDARPRLRQGDARDDAAALLDAYGVEDVPLGELDLTPGLIGRARAERGDAPLS